MRDEAVGWDEGLAAVLGNKCAFMRTNLMLGEVHTSP